MLQTNSIFIMTSTDGDLQAWPLRGKLLRTHTNLEMELVHHSTPYHLFINQNDIFYGCLPSPGSVIGHWAPLVFPPPENAGWPHCILSHHAFCRGGGAFLLTLSWAVDYWCLVLGVKVAVILVKLERSHFSWANQFPVAHAFSPEGTVRTIPGGTLPESARVKQLSMVWKVTSMQQQPCHLMSCFLFGVVTLNKPLKFPGTKFPHFG